MTDLVDNEIVHWWITRRPFELDQKDFSSSRVNELVGRYGSWENVKYPLGFRQDDLNEWVDKKYKVLEIGPGKGTSFLQLVEKGVDIYAAEPSLLSKVEDDDDLNELRKNLLPFPSRVKGIKAGDVDDSFGTNKFDVAFAIGVNFANYSNTPAELVSQIGGILRSLKKSESSFLAFELSKSGLLQFDVNILTDSLKTQIIDVRAFLDNAGFKTEVLPFFNGVRDSEAIKIWRMNKGYDLAEKIPELLHQDYSKYLVHH